MPRMNLRKTRRVTPKRQIFFTVIGFFLLYFMWHSWTKYYYGNYYGFNIHDHIFINYLKIPEDIDCYNWTLVTQNEVHIQSDSIYIIYPSCHYFLTIQQACSIESVFLTNKDKNIYVLSPLEMPEDIKKKLPSKIIYSTIIIQRIIENTPLEGIFNETFLEIGVHRSNRVLEMLKFAVLYKYGGTVIDLRFIMAKTVEFLGADWAVRVNDTTLGSDIVSVRRDSKLGRQLLRRTMQLLKQQANSREINGGVALTEAYRSLCFYKDSYDCNDFKIYEQHHFYPFNKSDAYFTNGSLKPLSYAYFIQHRTLAGRLPGTLYHNIMKEYCPDILESF